MHMVPSVLYEDSDIVVINKPAGLMVHGDGRFEGETLVAWILSTYPDMKGVGEPLEIVGRGPEAGAEIGVLKEIDRPGVVHRLDRDTSGLLVLARTPIARARLKKQFMGRQIQKTYRAFVYGLMSQERGVIDMPIGKSRSDFRRWSSTRGPRGVLRDARTDFKVLLTTPTASYVEVFPQTGRTHQIRVHFKAIHHPVICDSLYASGMPELLGFKRLALHAKSLTFTHPATGESVSFEAPLPPDFVEAENKLKEELRLL